MIKHGLLATGLALHCLLATADEVPVAVAANFAAPMRAIAAAFERATGHTAVVAVGSTGRFYAQVKRGAPFQVLLSADDETPARLEAEGFGVSGTRVIYAIGRLALWSATPGRVDARGDVLRQGGFDRLAIADPRLAPYGAAAMEVMERLDLLRVWQPRLVQGESVAQTWQFVASGNAPLGFVALSQVQVDGRITQGSAWVVPSDLHKPLRQEAILLQPGRNKPAARALMNFLGSPQARAIIRANGYEI